MSLLGDERKEVQEKARTALTSVLSSVDLKDSKALAEKSMKLAHSSMSVKRKKAGAKGSTTDTSAAVETMEAQKQRLKTQQTNVYALCALVLAFPYEVPEVIPPVLALLARFMNGPLAIVEVIRQTFTNFKRTHQDEWEVNHRLKFTQEQLDAFSEVLISPHYYA
jgi:proteasome activator subunit 4